MITDQKIKMLQIGLQYLLPELKQVSGEIEYIWEQPVFVDIYTKRSQVKGLILMAENFQMQIAENRA